MNGFILNYHTVTSLAICGGLLSTRKSARGNSVNGKNFKSNKPTLANPNDESIIQTNKIYAPMLFFKLLTAQNPGKKERKENTTEEPRKGFKLRKRGDICVSRVVVKTTTSLIFLSLQPNFHTRKKQVGWTI